MAFRDAANVRQTYTPAILAPFFCSVCSSEYLKYTLELVGRNRLSVVMHGQYHALILQIGFDPDRGVGCTIFHRVSNKIFNCPFDCLPVPPAPDRGTYDSKAGAMPKRELIVHFLYDLLYVEFLKTKAQSLSSLEFCGIEQILNHSIHTIQVVNDSPCKLLYLGKIRRAFDQLSSNVRIR